MEVVLTRGDGKIFEDLQDKLGEWLEAIRNLLCSDRSLWYGQSRMEMCSYKGFESRETRVLDGAKIAARVSVCGFRACLLCQDYQVASNESLSRLKSPCYY